MLFGSREEATSYPGVTKERQPNGTYKWYAIHPKTHQRVEIDPAQAWFWTPEWQAKERQVDDDLAAGRYQDFDNTDDFFNTRIR